MALRLQSSFVPGYLSAREGTGPFLLDDSKTAQLPQP